MRITARSVSGSSPISRPAYSRPSGKLTAICVASWTTWLLVKMNPSRAITNPEPLPPISRAPCRLRRCCLMSMLTTEDATRSATLTTVREYSSSKAESSEAEAPGTGGNSGAELASCKSRPSDGASSFGKVTVVTTKFHAAKTSSQLHVDLTCILYLESYSLLAPDGRFATKRYAKTFLRFGHG